MKTINIILVCSAGMSTSILVSKMRDAIQAQNLNYTVKAIASTEAITYAKEEDVDVILLGPQVKFMQNTFKQELAEKNIPIEMIQPVDYGTMNGPKVLEQAQKLLNLI